MTERPEAQTPDRDRSSWTRPLLIALIGLIIVAVGVVVVSDRRAAADAQAAADVQAAADALEATAWENRQVLDQVVIDTALLVGITNEPSEEREAPLTCGRNDGREGLSYFLHAVEGAPTTDEATTLATIEGHWREQQYTVNQRTIGDAEILSAVTPDGAILKAYVGLHSTKVTGATMCALTDGKPET